MTYLPYRRLLNSYYLHSLLSPKVARARFGWLYIIWPSTNLNMELIWRGALWRQLIQQAAAKQAGRFTI